MSYKSAFLQQTENLITVLNEILPNNYNIELFKEQFLLIKQMNSNLITKSFIKYVLPHKNHIVEHNDKFFLDGGGQEHLQKDNKFTLDIKKDWNIISVENKEIIWKYFNILVLLAEKIILETL
tara:strand:+ start:283 stop:651 length:369 start_codon:yes stop_codon:yes gene_type:complete